MNADRTQRKAARKAAKRGPQSVTIYQLRIQLSYIRPAIWRRVEVPGAFSFSDLHVVIQVAMGWEDEHLWAFYVGETEISPESEQFSFPGRPLPRPADSTTLDDAIAGRQLKFRYEYDMGDSWLHEIRVEKVLAAEPGSSYPRCTGGARACPPEDCGGFGGYMNLLKAIGNPRHPEHEEMREWVGEDWDPDAFDLNAVNARLQPRKRTVAARPAK